MITSQQTALPLNHCKAFPRSDSEIFPTAIHLSEKTQYLPDSEDLKCPQPVHTVNPVIVYPDLPHGGNVMGGT